MTTVLLYCTRIRPRLLVHTDLSRRVYLDSTLDKDPLARIAPHSIGPFEFFEAGVRVQSVAGINKTELLYHGAVS